MTPVVGGVSLFKRILVAFAAIVLGTVILLLLMVGSITINALVGQ